MEKERLNNIPRMQWTSIIRINILERKLHYLLEKKELRFKQVREKIKLGGIGQRMEKSLHSGIIKNQLAIAFEEFKRIPCPEPPESDDLYDLYSELMEYDGHVAGLVSSFLNGNQISRSLVYRNEKLIERLITNPDDTDELNLLKSYFEQLDEMIQMLRSLV